MRTFISACCVTVLALALSACDRAVATGAAITTAPSVSPALVASIRSVGVPYAPGFAIPGVAANGCIVYSNRGAAFDIAIVTSTRMDLNHVTIHLIDGTNVGGPMVTFPQSELTTQFGTTRVLPGIARTFTFRPQFPCGSIGANQVSAQLTLVDSTGAARSVSAVGPLP
jgi:hypothetical protein